jgi:hypothetical protein
MVAAFFTTALSRSLEAILAADGDRWAVEIAIRDGPALYGLGQDQCRTWRRIVGAHTFRLAMAAARTWGLWRTPSAQGPGPLSPLGPQQGGAEPACYRVDVPRSLARGRCVSHNPVAPRCR